MDNENQSDEQVLTFGQKAMGVTFNPSKDPVVNRIKEMCADLADEINDQRGKVGRGEAARYYSKAISYLEDAQMNAVKAVTWQHG